jgi:DNA polymerase-3 subunit gamma/tau
VKFLFATTEVDKLPVTVLSRCQRFDLKRIPAPLLAEHFAGICAKEGVEAEPEALAIIAEAAEGSARDGLSILDQAIAHADLAGETDATVVSADQVREMLGLADKTVQRRLFAALLGGDGAVLLDVVAAQFALGVEPLSLMRSAMELTHRVTVAQLGKGKVEALSAEERATIRDWAERLSAGQLHRLWQLLRCLHATDMPDPGQLVKRLEAAAASGALAAPAAQAGAGQGAVQMAAQGAGQGAGQAVAPPPADLGWEALVEQVERGSIPLGSMMRIQVRVIELSPGRLVYEQAPGFPEDVTGDLRQGLQRATGLSWKVERRATGGQPTLIEVANAEREAKLAAQRSSPLMQAALAAFPKAEQVEDDPTAGAPRRQGNWSR